MVHPTKAFAVHEQKCIAKRVLEGIYCSADHVLDAIARGWPKART